MFLQLSLCKIWLVFPFKPWILNMHANIQNENWYQKKLQEQDLKQIIFTKTKQNTKKKTWRRRVLIIMWWMPITTALLFLKHSATLMRRGRTGDETGQRALSWSYPRTPIHLLQIHIFKFKKLNIYWYSSFGSLVFKGTELWFLTQH